MSGSLFITKIFLKKNILYRIEGLYLSQRSELATKSMFYPYGWPLTLVLPNIKV